MSYMTKMTKRKRGLLVVIEQSEPMPIYQLAKKTGRNYRRVHDHVREFIKAGLVYAHEETRNGRRALIVESEYHQRLKRLDDMYAFKAGLHAA